MPRYVIYCNPPSIASLYDDWSDRPTSFDIITSSEAQQASSAALEDSYDLSLANDKHEDSYASEDLLLPPPSQLPSADFTAINEASYANDPSAIVHLPDYKFSPDSLTPLGQCATLHARAQQSGEPGPKYISVVGFVSLVEPIREVMQRGKEKKVIEVHLGDETGSMLISAWDAKAVGLASSIRLGDVLYLSDIALSHNAYKKRMIGTLTALSKYQICWRTKKLGVEDDVYRPDLRMACACKHPQSLRVQGVLEFAQRWVG